jgi:hypothetical protein
MEFDNHQILGSFSAHGSALPFHLLQGLQSEKKKKDNLSNLKDGQRVRQMENKISPLTQVKLEQPIVKALALTLIEAYLLLQH